MLTTADYLFAVIVYVVFRTINPDLQTLAEVVDTLLANNIDIAQIKVVTTIHCQQAESTEGGNSAQRHWVEKGK